MKMGIPQHIIAFGRASMEIIGRNCKTMACKNVAVYFMGFRRKTRT